MPTESLEARVTRHDREIAGIRKVIAAGMKMLVRIEATVDALAESPRALAASQRATDRMLQDLIKSLGRGGGNGNGHRKENIR